MPINPYTAGVTNTNTTNAVGNVTTNNAITATNPTWTFSGANVTITGTANEFTTHRPCTDHTTSDEYELVDGDIVSTCAHCKARIVVTKLPGGVDVLRIRDMLERLAAKDVAGELIAEYSALKASIKADQDALTLAESMLLPIELLLRQRGFFL